MDCECCRKIKHQLDIQVINNETLLAENSDLHDVIKGLEVEVQVLESELNKYRKIVLEQL